MVKMDVLQPHMPSLLDQATALHSQGRLDEAEQMYRSSHHIPALAFSRCRDEAFRRQAPQNRRRLDGEKRFRQRQTAQRKHNMEGEIAECFDGPGHQERLKKLNTAYALLQKETENAEAELAKVIERL